MSKPLILEIIKKIKLEMRPIGSIEINVTGENPANYIGGTWVAWGNGRVPVGVDNSDTDFNTVEKIGGEKTHILTVDELAEHRHTTWGVRKYKAGGTDAWIVNGEANHATEEAISAVTGGNQAHNNMQPYITCYMWKRIS